MAVERCERCGGLSDACADGGGDDDEKNKWEVRCCEKAGGMHKHRFSSTEEGIHKLVEKPWCHGTRICVCALEDAPYDITKIILREPVKMV
jgi:hypothetical protein